MHVSGVEPFDVALGDPALIVDPTDSEVADAENLSEWYGIDPERAKQLRRMLRGEISIDDWHRIRLE